MNTFRAMAIAIAVVALAGCQSMKSGETGSAPAAAKPAGVSGQQRFLCCNMRSETDWFSDGNFLVGRMFAAGTPVQITGEPSRSRMSFTMDGRPYRWGQEYSAKVEPFNAAMERVFVTQDPKARLNSYPPAVRQAITQGKLMKGMTKEQVAMSIGYPPADGTNLDSNDWRYRYNRFATYVVLFDQQGRLRDIAANEGVKTLLMLP